MDVKQYDSADRAQLDGYMTRADLARHFAVSRQGFSKWADDPTFPEPGATYQRGASVQPMWFPGIVSVWRDRDAS